MKNIIISGLLAVIPTWVGAVTAGYLVGTPTNLQDVRLRGDIALIKASCKSDDACLKAKLIVRSLYF